ncbi:hypothetical protein LTR53_015802, partial [Teratosphaeriaceae sp. CCFEE 6253]
LAAQILILCTLMAEKNPKGFAFSETTEDLQTAAFGCLGRVFEATAGSEECKAFLTSEANFPQLGQSITVLLDGIFEAVAVETQAAAVDALRALVEGVAGREVCATFLPGVVSKLAKVLTPSTKQRRHHRVLIGTLSVLCSLLRTTLGEDRVAEALGKVEKKGTTSIITEQWKQMAATQLKPALTSIMRLQAHSREDVREALGELCLLLLEHCRQTLAHCSPLALETLLALSAAETGKKGATCMQLQLLLRSDQSLSGLLQTSLYEGLQALPTVMQGAEEEKKVRRLEHMSAAYALLVDSGSDTAVLDRMLAGSLRDGLVITLQGSGGKPDASGTLVSTVQSMDLTTLDDSMSEMEFGQALVRHRGQEEVVDRIDAFARLISASSSSSAFAASLARSLRFEDGETQIGTFSLLLTATRAALRRKDKVDDLLNFDDSPISSVPTDHLEDLYAFALTLLSTPADAPPPDPHLQALALRTLALSAQTAGREFRTELIDALYPVLATLATPSHPSLQRDSLTTLNILASACAYPSVKDLIVGNTDYLTNAVSLKLHSGDVGPQAPQVLLMMVRLAGPGLVPYLEDVVESVFAVLEQWHGYGVLVEVLFAVLGVVAEEGVKAEGLLGMEGRGQIGRGENEGVVERDEPWRPMEVSALAEMLKRRREEEHARNADEREPHPTRPWAGIQEIGTDDESGESTAQSHVNNEGTPAETDDRPNDDEEVPPPAPKTYSLLLKITSLTQHFLPSASPALQSRLLSLVRTTIPALARHENSFLPLINTLWPEIVSRLEEGEAEHVRAAALEVVGMLCTSAGGFMRGRIVGVWEILRGLHGRLASELAGAGGAVRVPGAQRKVGRVEQTSARHASRSEAQHRLLPPLGRPTASPDTVVGTAFTATSTRLLWDAFTASLTGIVRSVPLPPELLDSAIEMLEPVLEKGAEVREALERANGDAVWLARARTGTAGLPDMPTASRAQLAKGWEFATLPILVAG